jgi:hypothetical protein
MSTQVCGRCAGDGNSNQPPYDNPCLGCGGDGHVVVPDPPTKCGRCGGDGNSNQPPYESPCRGCGGCGWVLS